MSATPDRLVFDKVQLDNGITVYFKPMDVPFVMCNIRVPVGTIHNTGAILPGSAHMLEHLCASRSRRYPERRSFADWVQSEGGSSNASTSATVTEYTLSIASESFDEAFRGLASRAFDPLISEDDLRHETGIVSNERKRRNRWFPATTQLDHYCQHGWKHDFPFSLRQTLGIDNDLESMSPEGMYGLHEHYKDPRVCVFVGGTFNAQTVISELEQIVTIEHSLPVEFDQVRWANRKYHEKQIEDTNRFEYHLGGIIENKDEVTAVGMLLIRRILIDNVDGALHRWLRRELAWCYEMSFHHYKIDGPVHNDWEVWIPLNSVDQVSVVRKEIHGRIVDAISKKDVIARVLDRIPKQQVFQFQTLEDILESAEFSTLFHGRLITETEGLELADQFRDPSRLLEIYERHMSPAVTGEFLALPKTTTNNKE